MEIRWSDPLDTMIGGLDTIEIAAPVPYVSATFLDSHAGAMDGGEVCGSLAVPALNMEESQEDHDKEGQKRVRRISLSCKLLSLRRLGF